MPQGLDKVNWNLIRHHHRQAKRLLAIMEAAHSDDAKVSFLRTAIGYIEELMRQLEDLMEPLRLDAVVPLAALLLTGGV